MTLLDSWLSVVRPSARLENTVRISEIPGDPRVRSGPPLGLRFPASVSPAGSGLARCPFGSSSKERTSASPQSGYEPLGSWTFGVQAVCR